MRCYPNLTIFKYFLFPYRDGLFKGIDDIAASFKSGGAVGGGYSDNYRYLPNLQYPGAVMDERPLNRPLLKRLFHYFFHFGKRHRFISFKLQAYNRLAFSGIPYCANKYINAA